MATLRDIRKRISSVKGTQQITKAMKMVAAAKLRKSQDAVLGARPYSDAVSRLFRHLVGRAADMEDPLVVRRKGNRVLYVVVTGERGMCGGFNANIIRAATRAVKSSSEDVSLALIGKKGIDHFKKHMPGRVEFSWPEALSPLEYGKAVAIGDELKDYFLSGGCDRIVILYNRFISPLRQEVTFQPWLPVDDPEEGESKEEVLTDYIYEPGRDEVWSRVIPRYLHFEIFRCLLDSVAGEFGARMTSMDAATKNAGEMIDRLTLEMNRARQASITRELMEIIAGKEAQGG